MLYRRIIFILLTCIAVAAQAQTGWSLRNQRTGGDDLWGVASGSRGLVAVGTNGAILHSSDSAAWTRRASGTNDWLLAVTFGLDRYIAVGDRGRILSSSDGVTWSAVAQTATTQRLNNVIFARERFVAVGEGGMILTSTDGTTWTAVSSGTTNWLRGLAFGRGTETGSGSFFATDVFIAVGQAGTALLSTDALTWTPANLQTTADLEAAVFSDGGHSHPVAGPGGGTVRFVVSGQGGVLRTVFINKADSLSLSQTTPSISSPALGTTAPIRALLAGARSFNAYQISASSFGGDTAAPITAIDETGRAFSNYGNPTTDPWSTEAISFAPVLRAGTYSPAQDAFVAVGTNETIVTRGELFTGRAVNLSTRGFVEGTTQGMIGGFVVRGTANKRVLLRGIGPALANFGFNSPLARASLTLFDNRGAVVASNAGWDADGRGSAIASAATQVGAFALAAGSRDAALLVDLAPGVYSAQITGAENASGVALVEIYDVDAPANGASRAINLSTRGRVGAGASALVAGLVVHGPQFRRFLVRGVGPSLAKFGVSGVLPDPVVRITARQALGGGSSFVPSPSGGGSATDAAIATGAFPFDAGAQDDAFVLTLAPGIYTFDLTSRSGASGAALIEIYEIGLSQPSF